MKLVTILFGSGWWVLWHLFIVGSIIPMFILLRRVQRMKPDAEPESGETPFFVLLGIALGLAVATVADGAMLGWKMAAFRGAAWGTISGLAFCMLWTLVLFGFANKLAVPKEDEPTTVLPATITFAVWHAGIVVANLTALYRIHG